MKHTIEIEGLPEGYEVKNIKVTEKQPWDNGSIAALIYVKKKQPRRIVLEETDEENYLYKSGQCAAFSAGEFVISGTRNKWRIVEDSGENDD